MDINYFVNKHHLGNCIEIMKGIPDESVDFVFTSPPYQVGEDYEKGMKREEYEDMITKCVKGVGRVLKKNRLSIFNLANPSRKNNYVLTYNAHLAAAMSYYREFIWEKTQLTRPIFSAWTRKNPSVLNYLPNFDHEYLMLFEKGLYKERDHEQEPLNLHLAEMVKSSVWRLRGICNDEKAGHGATFPLILPHMLIDFFTFKGDVVLDPFSGSGTTAIACEKLGRKWIGCELDPKYHADSIIRMEKFKSQSNFNFEE